jgi:hypothetical protein
MKPAGAHRRAKCLLLLFAGSCVDVTLSGFASEGFFEAGLGRGARRPTRW